MFDGYTPLFAAAASIFATVGATWLPFLIGLLRTKTARTFAFVLLLAVLGGLALSGLLSLGAAILTALCVLASAWCSDRYRMTPRVVIQALDEGARGAVGVGAACVIIGIIIGTVSLTGLGLTFGYEVLKYVGEGQLYLGGLFVMIMSTILGMGVPGVAAYAHRGGRGGPGAHGRGRDADGGAHVLPVLRLPLQHHAAGRHVVLCGGGHCAFGSDPHVPHCGKARPDRIHPALLFPEQPTPAVQLGPIRLWRRCGRSPQPVSG